MTTTTESLSYVTIFSSQKFHTKNIDIIVYKCYSQKIDGIVYILNRGEKMAITMDILRLFVTIMVAFLAGKLLSKLKLPSILGWLIIGMMTGPQQ